MIGADLWEELGGFDERFVNGGEDVDLCFRACARGRRNVVALRSVVRHHISSSIGRKLRDEANSELLAARWRDAYVHHAARRWCRAQLDPMLADPRDFEARFAWRVWRFARGWSRTPPPEAIHALNRALDLEFVRWKSLRDSG
jgi:O-antigen biosynthesis protein